jgi:hypothetical protein
MNTASIVIGILGGVAGLVSIVVAIGRWVGRRDVGEEKISEEGRAARDETRQSVKRIEETVSTLQAETKEGFERIGERMRPLLDRHAQQQTVDRDLAAVTSESKENRERIIRLETRADELARARPARPRNRKTGGS